MQRYTLLILALAAGALITLATATHAASTFELADKVLDHINERMYDTCKRVVLERHTDAIYQGYAEFLNGIKIDLEVTVTDNLIEYHFLKRPQPLPQTTHDELSELQMLVTQQDAEIARLRAVCQQAGIDPDATPVSTAAPTPDDANTPPPPLAEVVVREDQQTPPDDLTFTWQLYHKIQKGMSYPRVVELLGHHGHLLSSSDFDNGLNDVFVWTNPDDSHICVVFRNGAVLIRTQNDLPDTDNPQAGRTEEDPPADEAATTARHAAPQPKSPAT